MGRRQPAVVYAASGSFSTRRPACLGPAYHRPRRDPGARPHRRRRRGPARRASCTAAADGARQCCRRRCTRHRGRGLAVTVAVAGALLHSRHRRGPAAPLPPPQGPGSLCRLRRRRRRGPAAVPPHRCRRWGTLPLPPQPPPPPMPGCAAAADARLRRRCRLVAAATPQLGEPPASGLPTTGHTVTRRPRARPDASRRHPSAVLTVPRRTSPRRSACLRPDPAASGSARYGPASARRCSRGVWQLLISATRLPWVCLPPATP